MRGVDKVCCLATVLRNLSPARPATDLPELRQTRDGYGTRGSFLRWARPRPMPPARARCLPDTAGSSSMNCKRKSQRPVHDACRQLSSAAACRRAGMPVAVSPIDRQVRPVLGQLRFKGRDESPILVVDRALAPEAVVVFSHFQHALAWHVFPAQDVFQETALRLRAAPDRRKKPPGLRRSACGLSLYAAERFRKVRSSVSLIYLLISDSPTAVPRSAICRKMEIIARDLNAFGRVLGGNPEFILSSSLFCLYFSAQNRYRSRRQRILRAFPAIQGGGHRWAIGIGIALLPAGCH